MDLGRKTNGVGGRECKKAASDFKTWEACTPYTHTHTHCRQEESEARSDFTFPS